MFLVSPGPRACSWLLLAGCALALGCGTSSEPEQITAATSKYQAADGEESTPDSSQLADQNSIGPGGSGQQGYRPPARVPASGSTSEQPLANPGPTSNVGRASPTAPVTGSSSLASERPAGTAPPAGTRNAGSAIATTPIKPSSTPPAGGAVAPPKSNRAEDLLAHIKQLATQEPSGLTVQDAEADFKRIQEAMILTAEQLFNLDTEISTRREAAEAKLSALASLQQIGVPEAGQRTLDFCAELQENADAELAQLGRRAAFAYNVNDYLQSEISDAGPLFDQFKQLMAAERKDARLLEFSRQIVNLFEQGGREKEAYDVLQLIAAEYKDVSDPELVPQVAKLNEESKLLKADMRGKFEAMIAGKPGAAKEFLDASKSLIEDGDVGETTARILVQQAALTLESVDPESGAELYALIERKLSDHPNADVAALVNDSLDHFQRRRDLMNQRFVVSGNTLDGQSFDWRPYRGKVVLIDFWATWCGPCLQAMPHIRQTYEKYRKKGYEIVGINLDDNRKDVERFFSVQHLPWPTVVSADPTKKGMQTPLAVKCGVNFLPFVVLVGRDGRVAAVNIRGPALDEKLDELLGTDGQ